MGLINRKGADSDGARETTTFDDEKHAGDSGSSGGISERLPPVDDMKDPHTRLHRGLKSRQITMIAIGGAM